MLFHPLACFGNLIGKGQRSGPLFYFDFGRRSHQAFALLPSKEELAAKDNQLVAQTTFWSSLCSSSAFSK